MLYFNESDPFCAQWCRNAFGVEVDERDIRTIERPTLAVRQHYFAGIGGWEYALELAEWPEDREIWTGSCPCQPFSVAGKRQAAEDERDLWPAFFRLIAIARPAIILGEQVNGAIAYGWLDRICDDLEGIGYAVGAAVLPACGVAAPHIRQRLYWVAYSGPRGASQHARAFESEWREPRPCGETGRLAFPESQQHGSGQPRSRWRTESANGGSTGGLGDSDRPGRQGYRDFGQCHDQFPASRSQAIHCTDGRWRRVPLESWLLPLADSGRFGNPKTDRELSSRIGALKGAGNAIVIPLAAEFIRAVMELAIGCS